MSLHWLVFQDRLCNTTLLHALTLVQPQLANARGAHMTIGRPALRLEAGGGFFLDLRQTERQMHLVRAYVRARASPSMAFINGADVCRP